MTAEPTALRHGDIVVPDGKHWRRARQLVDRAAEAGADGFVDALYVTPDEDVPVIAYCLAKMVLAGDAEVRPHTRQIGRPRIPTQQPYTEEEAREAHRLHAKGDRSTWAVEGQRVYARRRKQAQRANGVNTRADQERARAERS